MSPQLLPKVRTCRLHTDLVIESISNGMRALDMASVKAHKVNFKNLDWPATYFVGAYKGLIRVLQRPLPSAPPLLSSAPLLSSTPTSAPYKTPPHQTTVPANPNLSKESDSSLGSSSSCESKPEPFIELFMADFVAGVLNSIEDELAMPISWLRNGQEYGNFYLSMEYDLLPFVALTR
jgi:hypothetical protein